MQEYNLTIILPEGREKELKVSEAITLKTLAEEFEQYYDDQIILAMIDGKLRELNKKVDRSGKLSFITVADRDGKKTYRRSVLLLLQKAVQKLYGNESMLKVLYSLGQGYYCELVLPESTGTAQSKCGENCESSVIEGSRKVKITATDIEHIRTVMDTIAEQDITIYKRSEKTERAEKEFRDRGMNDKARLLHYRRSSRVNLYSLDDYYADREFCPRNPDGSFDFECLEALDVELFNQNMSKLLNGEEIDAPSFNFKTGKREYRGRKMSLSDGEVLVIEGIHGLNDRMSYMLPEESKFRIYISALTQLNIDEHNPLPTTDARLIRRIVRDARTRGTDARETIAMWPSVRKGEEENIFPFQDSADVMFNSALVYELAVLKVYAEPLLFAIPKGCPEYLEAKRLLKFMDYFLPMPSEGISNNSLVREFIGGSCFNV